MSLFRKPELNAPWAKKAKITEPVGKNGKTSSSSRAGPAGSQNDSNALDADIAILKQSFAQADAEKKENSYGIPREPWLKVFLISALGPELLKARLLTSSGDLSSASSFCRVKDPLRTP
jgi:hypothetical protein